MEYKKIYDIRGAYNDQRVTTYLNIDAYNELNNSTEEENVVEMHFKDEANHNKSLDIHKMVNEAKIRYGVNLTSTI